MPTPAPAGYSGTPLVKKLGIKEGTTFYPANAPDHYLELLGGLPEGVKVINRLQGTVDFVHLFVKERAELEELLGRCLKRLTPDGTIWVSWPKKASKVPTDITEDVIRQVALPTG